MSKYSRRFEVRNYEADLSGHLEATTLLKFLTELATEHSSSVDIDVKDLKEQSRGWMIYKWKAKIDEYPKIGERIRIDTWTSRLYKFYANREFVIYNEDENIIGKASSLWLYIDMERRRPIRIPEIFNEKYGVISEFNFKDFENLDEDIETEKSVKFNVRNSDIDYNEHVNNAVYFEWMLESLDRDYTRNNYLSEFDITYKREVLFGESISSELLEDREKNIFNHIIRKDESNEVSALGKTIWEKR